MSLLAIRREVIDYGAIPLASWLYHGDSPAAIQTLLLLLLEAGQEEGDRCESLPCQRSCAEPTVLAIALSKPHYVAALPGVKGLDGINQSYQIPGSG